MAWICDKNGQHRCEVKNISYNGVFMDVSSITATVESAEPISFAIGDYIEWDYDGLRYTLDAAAGVEKQARSGSVGNAFVYENLVFLSPINAAGNVDFLDVVLGNTNDFLTNTEFSFYGTAWDYAKRLEANLCRVNGSGSWKVRIWTGGTCYDNAPATGIDTGSWENKLVDVSGIKCLAGFQQIYELWGCAYVFSVDNGVNYVDFYDDFEQYAKAWKVGGVDKIFAYGKGNGLYKIRHTPDADHVLVTRLRAYGSGDNLPANYYLNSPDYHVDGNESSELAISRLMLPASQWTKGGVKGPVNAYLEQNTALYGVREASVCWDGSDPELGEIKPSIYGLTIQDLLDLMAAGTTYRPVPAKWPDTTQRIDKIITGAAPVDNGVAAEAGYDFTVVESSGSLSSRDMDTIRIYTDVDFSDIVMGSTPSVSHLAEYRIVPVSTNKTAVSFDVPASVMNSIESVNATLTPRVNGLRIDDATFPCAVTEESISNTVNGVLYKKRYTIQLLDSSGSPIVFSTMYAGEVTFLIQAHINLRGGVDVDRIDVLRKEYALSFNLLRGNKAIDKFFSVTIPQVGFDIAAAVTSGAKLCMRSGDNQPREFQIVPSSVRYLADSDTWYLRCKRTVDQSISTYFPNSDYVIAAGDEYYLTGIAMPSLYVEIAAQKLLEAATAWLARHSKPRMLSSVEVDNKIMAEEGIVLKEGMSLPLSDTDLGVTPQNQESRIIDNIRIEEGTNSIRTFTITLRGKKEKSSLDAAIRGATSNLATNSSVSEALSAMDSRDHGSLSGRDMPNQHPISSITGLEEALASIVFFELDGNGNVKLKDEYGGLWTKGWLADGGIGTDDGSGGGSSTLYGLNDVDIPVNPGTNDLLSYNGSVWVNVHKSDLLSGLATTQDLASKQNAYPFTITGQSGQTYDLSNLGVTVDNKNAEIGTTLTTLATVGGVDIKAKIPTIPSAPGTLVTNNSTAQTASSGESLSGTINLHKIAKTGTYSDLIGTPTTMKNPFALTFGNQTYDGSVAKTITAASLGALTSHQTVTLASGTNNGTLKLTTAAGTTDNIAVKGLGSLAFLSDISGDYVTRATAQSISGAKTFSADVTLSGVNLVPATDNTCSLGTGGSGGKRINSAHIRNIYTSYFEFRNSAGTTKVGGFGVDGTLASIVVTSGGTDYAYKFYSTNNDGNGLFYQPPQGQTQHVPLGKSDHRWTAIYGVEGNYSGAITLSGDSNETRRIYFGGSTYYLELKDLGSGQNPRYALHTNVPFYSDYWIADGGIGSGSGGGGLITLVKSINDLGTAIATESLTETFSAKAIESIYEAVQGKQPLIDANHKLSYNLLTDTPTIPAAQVQSDWNATTGMGVILNKPSIPTESTVSGWGFTKNTGTVTSVGMTVPTGLSVSGSPITTNGTLAVSFANGYSIPTTAKQGNWDTAYSTVTGSQTTNKVFASPSNASGAPSFRALVAADIPNLDAGKINSGTLDSARLPSMYIGKTAVKFSNANNDTLIGISGFTTASSASASNDSSKVVWDSDRGAWHFLGNLYADGWIADGGIGSSSSGGVDLARVWESLTNNTDEPNVKINLAHIPDITTAKVSDIETWIGNKGFLTSSSLSGYATQSWVGQQGYITGGYIGKTALQGSSASQDLTGIKQVVFESNSSPSNNSLSFAQDGFYNRPRWTYRDSQTMPATSVTKFLAYKDEIPTSLKNPYKLSFQNAGGTTTVQYDGSEAKVVTAADLGALTSHQSLANYVTLDGMQTITGNKTFSNGITFGGNIIPSTDLGASLGYSTHRISDANIRTLTITEVNLRDNNNTVKTGYFTAKTGALAFFVETSASGIDLSDATTYKKYTFDSGCFCPAQSGTNLGYNNSGGRWNNYYGVNADLSGNLSLAQTSQITLGPVTITYDATNKALHISGTDNGQTIGIYCDGWIADGGIRQTT